MLPIANWIPEDELDLVQFAGERVEVSGIIVHMERFDERSTVIINRPGIPIYVHVPHLDQGQDYLKANVGDFVRVKGVLATRRASAFPPVQLLVKDFTAFT
ncbi:MAG: hypothetical protein HKN43_07840, partial [Rhodothermales bacterium]|nr:hypothetical protein [Rhodothermales bacterium]